MRRLSPGVLSEWPWLMAELESGRIQGDRQSDGSWLCDLDGVEEMVSRAYDLPAPWPPWAGGPAASGRSFRERRQKRLATAATAATPERP
jgi:hypothetical protein